MKSHQRLIREQHAQEYDPLLVEKLALAQSLDSATVREISRADAKTIILKYEWLGNMGCTDFTFGLYFGEHLAGVACFGRTAGTNTAASVCGKDYEHLVRVLNRGACVHWAHEHSASFLIPRACNLMAEKGFNIFVAYSDADAGEIGTVYQATNWHYCGTTNSASSGFVWSGKPIPKDLIWGTFKDGKVHDDRNIHHLTRLRNADGILEAYRIKCTRHQMRERMTREGFLCLKAQPKGRYVTFAGDKKLVKELRAALQWNVLPYPKRQAAA
ncbi:MAG: hypothetical protein WCA19_02010 [Candidatus Acidiferrales bacterium]